MSELRENTGEASEGQRALLSNLAAVRAVTGAVEGTLGPKGLDCLMVDDCGEIVLTNDGVTILQLLDVAHPAGRLMIQAARAQERAVGDGTTTTVLLAGALIGEGANQVLRGVPPARVIDGIRAGIGESLIALAGMRRAVSGPEDELLCAVARVAGRGDPGLARTITAAARLLGGARLLEPGFSMAEAVLGLEGAADEAFPGVIVEREPAAAEMPARLDHARVLVIEGALELEAFDAAAGFTHAEAKRDAFQAELDRLCASGVSLILTGGGMDDLAVQTFVEHGILGVRRVAESTLRRAASFCGARILRRPPRSAGSDRETACGRASLVEFDRSACTIRLSGGAGPGEVTIVVGGSTSEVVAERERIARDAAAAVQHALRSGVVPGGGAAELAIARALDRPIAAGIASYGVSCVREALRRPLAQLVANAGFNPLEKVEEAYAAQERTGRPDLGIDAETGAVADLDAAGIWDPYAVKEHALKTAGEVAVAVLRINSILRMRTGSRDGNGWHDPA